MPSRSFPKGFATRARNSIPTPTKFGVIRVVDDGPSPSAKLPWKEWLLLRIRLAVPGDGRKKVKRLIGTADAWLKSGHHDAARRLYQEAIELAKEFKSHHLGKVAVKRLREAELKRMHEARRSEEVGTSA